MNKLMKGFVLASLLCGTVHAQHLPKWLEKAVVYQIYPASFKDSNGDGVGDLKGIESQLDYIKSIGVNTIWISPIFSSEFKDGGYDITDFYAVDKRYGTNTELVNLVTKVHEKGMKIFMDLVAGHTSDKHPWFQQSKQADTNLQYSDYFIWTPSKKEKPNQFVATTEALRDGNYMKNFFDCQPALNYGYANPNPEHPWEQSVDAPGPQAVRRELKNIISFWMDKGMDGFRVDMAFSLIKNDPEHTETSHLWKEISSWFTGKYPEGAFIAEWGEPTNSIAGGFHIDFLFHIGRKQGYTSLFFNKKKTEDINCYFEKEGTGQVKTFIDIYQKEYGETKGKGYISFPTSNHDIWRLACGKRTDINQLKVAMTFLLTMPGVPCIYYGDEIGMRYIEGLPDVEGSVLASRNRAGSRTPMQWNKSVNAGFSTAPTNKLYIPVDTDQNAPNVEQQQKEATSLLNYVRGILKLRDSSKALGNTGEWKLISDVNRPYPLIYLREAGGERYCIALNPSGKKVSANFDTLGAERQQLVVGDKQQAKFSSGSKEDKIVMAPVSAVIFKLID